MTILLTISTVVLALLLFVMCFFLWKFAKIIMIFEDDLSETIESLNEVEDAINGVLEMQMFFDSPEVKKAVQGVLEQVRLCRITIQSVVQRFTARSKREYVTIWDKTPEPESLPEDYIPRLPGQPPGTPNPMEVIQREGIVLDVGRTRK
jgi:hypothetical protein